MICPNCNTANREGAGFCMGCGTRLVSAPPAFVPPQPNAPAAFVPPSKQDEQLEWSSPAAGGFPLMPSVPPAPHAPHDVSSAFSPPYGQHASDFSSHHPFDPSGHKPLQQESYAAPVGQLPVTVTGIVQGDEIVVTDIEMRFVSMIAFMVKFAIASIPALLILLLIFGLIANLFIGALWMMF